MKSMRIFPILAVVFLLAGLTAHAQLNSYRFGGPRPIDEKKLDFQAAFLEVGTSTGANSVALRAGRLELEYGLRTFD
jgi:hypothetical protein